MPEPLPARTTWWTPRRRAMLYAGIIIVVTYGLWCALLYKAQDQMMFPRSYAPKPMGDPPADAVLITRPVDGGHAVAWLLPPFEPKGRAPLLVYFHGNAEIIDQQVDGMWLYRKLGFAVLLPEYRGYGRSPGEPSEDAIAEDTEAFLQQALQRDDIDASRLVIHGRSLGGGAASTIIPAHKPAALILESTFSSAAAMAGRYFAPSFLVKSPFRTDLVLAELDTPTLIIHGTHDPVIPVSHARRLKAIARRGVYHEWNFEHDDLYARGLGKTYEDTLAAFLREHVAGLR